MGRDLVVADWSRRRRGVDIVGLCKTCEGVVGCMLGDGFNEVVVDVWSRCK